MTQIEFTEVSGNTPIDVYVADYRGENRYFIGTITGATSTPVPPTVYQYPPPLFNTIEAIMLILSASNGCETFKIIGCNIP